MALSVAAVAWAADDATVVPLMTKDLAGVVGKEARMLTVGYPLGAA
jgi:hypothetical protein